jgi:hypothetical protein
MNSFTAVWYPVGDLPTETVWMNLAAATVFADVLFRRRTVLAVKVWQGDNPEDPFRFVWQEHPALVYRQIKAGAYEHFFHLQNSSNETYSQSSLLSPTRPVNTAIVSPGQWNHLSIRSYRCATAMT